MAKGREEQPAVLVLLSTLGDESSLDGSQIAALGRASRLAADLGRRVTLVTCDFCTSPTALLGQLRRAGRVWGDLGLVNAYDLVQGIDRRAPRATGARLPLAP
nr:hypothetical protein [Succinivibrionaceae bacterium]